MDNRTLTSLWLTQKFPHSWSCPHLPGLLCSLHNLHQCLKISNQLHHYPKGQPTCILFIETYQSSNEIHCQRTQTACNSWNTCNLLGQPFDYNLHQSQDSYLFKLHYQSCHLVVIDCWGIWSPHCLPSQQIQYHHDTLSHLPKLNEPHDKSTFLKEIFAFNEQLNAFTIAFDVTSKAQLTNNKIQWCITNSDPDFETRIIQWAPLVYFKGKIAIPANLHSCVLTWYHKNLLHPSTNWMFHTISQHFTWPSLCT
jgi:hypothetical protein